MLERGACLCAEDDLRASAHGDLLMAADEISVQVRFDHVFDFESVRRGFGEIRVDVTLRIDDRSLPIRTDQVRRVRETSEIELFEVHDKGYQAGTNSRQFIKLARGFQRAEHPIGPPRAVLDAPRSEEHTSELQS